MADNYENVFLPELLRGGGTGMAEAMVQGPLMAEQYRQSQLANELAQWKIETEKARPQHMQALDALMALRAKQQGESLGSERAKIIRQLMSGELTFTPEVAVYLGINPYQVVQPGATALNKTTGQPDYTAPWAPKAVPGGGALALPGATPDAPPTMVEGPEKTFAPKSVKEQIAQKMARGESLSESEQDYLAFDQKRAVERSAAVGQAGALARGQVQDTRDAREKIANMDNVSVLLDQIQGLADHLITAESGPEALAQGAMLTARTWLREDDAAKSYRDMRQSFLGVISRTLGGEKGVLTDRDIIRIDKALPQFSDTKRTKDFKIGAIRLILQTAAGAQKRVLSGEPPDPALRSRLNELLAGLDAAPLQTPQPTEPLPAMPGLGSPKPPPLTGQPHKPGLLDAEVEKAKQVWRAKFAHSGMQVDLDRVLDFGKTLKTPQAQKAWDIVIKQYMSKEFVP